MHIDNWLCYQNSNVISGGLNDKYNYRNATMTTYLVSLWFELCSCEGISV